MESESEQNVRQQARTLEAANAALIEHSRMVEALRRSEERFRQVAESAGEFIWEVDTDGLYLYASRAVEQILGYKPEEIVGRMHFYDLFALETREETKTAAFEIFARRQPFRAFLNLNLSKDGRIIALETSGLPILDGNGDFLGYRGSDKDSTERKRAEDALRESQQHLVSIYNTVEDAIFHLAIEPEGQFRIVSVNAALLRVTGLSQEKVVGKTVNEVIPEPSLTIVLGKYRQAIEEKTVVRWEETSDYPAGRLTGEVCVAPVFDNTGTCTHLVGSVHDITERKQADTEIARQAQLLGQAHEPMFAWDLDGTINYWNNAAETLYGFSRVEAMGQFSHELLQTENSVGMAQLDANLESVGAWKGDLLQTAKDGRRLLIETAMTVVVDRDGRRVVLETGRDITERKQAQEIENQLTAELTASHDEIRALAASLLTAQEEERHRLSRDLHDEICQQLGSLAADMTELVASPLPKDAQRQLKELRARVIKVAEETRHIAYGLQSTTIDDLGLVASLRALCDQFSEQNPSIALEFTGGALPSAVPREVAYCLYRVAQEALQNIARHSEAKHVAVALSWQKGSVLLSLEDDGVGFDPESVRGRGGLGLISMQERTRLVKGNLSVSSGRLGHGTRIVLSVPLPDGNITLHQQSSGRQKEE